MFEAFIHTVFIPLLNVPREAMMAQKSTNGLTPASRESRIGFESIERKVSLKRSGRT
jgi:hypothetical protein